MPYLDDVKKKGNFAFIEGVEPELYRRLYESEREIRLNIKSAAKQLRGALEYFYQKETKSDYRDEDPLFKMMKMYHENNPVQEGKMHNLRIALNQFVHPPESSDKQKEKEKEFDTVVSCFKTAFGFFKQRYIRDSRKMSEYEFYNNYIPINNYFIYEAVVDKESECELICHAHKYDRVTKDFTNYALIKIYKQAYQNTRYLKDIEVLRSLWNETPDHRYFARFTEADQAESNTYNEYYIIRYELDQKPNFLTSDFINSINTEQRNWIAIEVFRAVKILHNLPRPIYHRNIRPENILLCSFGENYNPYIVNFEYAKLIDSRTDTMVVNVKKKAKSDSTYIAREVRDLDYASELPPEQWEKADVYSLAALIVFILSGHELSGIASANQLLKGKYDREFCDFIGKMLGSYNFRPSLNEATEIFERYLAVGCER